jgi:hypothetical protein
MVDMVLVHLVWEGLQVGRLLTVVIGEYTRFAAGGFVFVAGAGVGLVFLPRARHPGQRRSAYGDLWRRAAYVLGVHYAAAASFLALDVCRGHRVLTVDSAALVRDVLAFREMPPYGDILPLYVALLAFAPVLLELMRRRLWPLVALGSAVLFAVGQYHPWVLSPRVPELFPVILWQAPFVAGLLFGALLPRLDRTPRPTLIAVAAFAGAAYAGLTLAAQAAALGLSVAPLLTFEKVPLNGAELLRYLTATLLVVLGTGLAWRRLERRALTRLVEVIGRRSLAVYVAHVWVQAAVTAIAARLAWVGAAQVLLAPVALLALGALAWGLELSRPRGTVRIRLAVASRRGGALPAGALVACVLIVVLGNVRPPLPPGDGEAVVEVRLEDPVADLPAEPVEVEAVELEPGPQEVASPPTVPDSAPTEDMVPDPFREEALFPPLTAPA